MLIPALMMAASAAADSAKAPANATATVRLLRPFVLKAGELRADDPRLRQRIVRRPDGSVELQRLVELP